MHYLKAIFNRLFSGMSGICFALVICAFLPNQAFAASIIDSFDLSPFVPLVLETMMNMATSLYEYFVGNGDGLIYLFVYGFLIFYLSMYLVKMYIPKPWLAFLGSKEGGEMWDGKTTAWSIAENVAKPCIRAIIAGLILLQIKPIYVTQWLVNPFLEFGSFYTEIILKASNNSSLKSAEIPGCPESVKIQDWISKDSCDFLVKPVYIVSKENNRVIKYGLDFIKTGLRGLLTLIPHGGENLLNIITGILLVSSFVASNLFMALLIIQGIFDLCLSLIMYPFNVLSWVAKKSDKWVDVLPAFKQIIDSLKRMVIIMIACAFILSINIAFIRALFSWSSSIFVVAANGTASSNVPTISQTTMNFGEHSVLWLSSLLTFFVMQNVFKLTRERLDLYTKGTPHTLYDSVTGDAKRSWEKVKTIPDTIKTLWGAGKKVAKK